MAGGLSCSFAPSAELVLAVFHRRPFLRVSSRGAVRPDGEINRPERPLLLLDWISLHCFCVWRGRVVHGRCFSICLYAAIKLLATNLTHHRLSSRLQASRRARRRNSTAGEPPTSACRCRGAATARRTARTAPTRRTARLVGFFCRRDLRGKARSSSLTPPSSKCLLRRREETAASNHAAKMSGSSASESQAFYFFIIFQNHFFVPL